MREHLRFTKDELYKLPAGAWLTRVSAHKQTIAWWCDNCDGIIGCAKSDLNTHDCYRITAGEVAALDMWFEMASGAGKRIAAGTPAWWQVCEALVAQPPRHGQ